MERGRHKGIIARCRGFEVRDAAMAKKKKTLPCLIGSGRINPPDCQYPGTRQSLLKGVCDFYRLKSGRAIDISDDF